tara:strand:+ start:746 stop:922 length:177 start_codon:yes stop_codon:yes gene_type:complete
MVSIFSLYVAINAGFAFGGYYLSQYSFYLGIWAGFLAFSLFTSIVLYVALSVIRQVRG